MSEMKQTNWPSVARRAFGREDQEYLAILASHWAGLDGDHSAWAYRLTRDTLIAILGELVPSQLGLVDRAERETDRAYFRRVAERHQPPRPARPTPDRAVLRQAKIESVPAMMGWPEGPQRGGWSPIIQGVVIRRADHQRYLDACLRRRAEAGEAEAANG